MPAEYAAIFAEARDNLRLGNFVVIDAQFACVRRPAGLLQQRSAGGALATCQTVGSARLCLGSANSTQTAPPGAAPGSGKLRDWTAFWPTWGQLTVEWRAKPRVCRISLVGDIRVDEPAQERDDAESMRERRLRERQHDPPLE